LILRRMGAVTPPAIDAARPLPYQVTPLQ